MRRSISHAPLMQSWLFTLVACGGPAESRKDLGSGSPEAGTLAPDAGAADGAQPVIGTLPVLGVPVFDGPPYRPRALPVRRLALGSSDDAFCVVLEDRTLHCENSGTDFTARVPDNRMFDWVDAPLDTDEYAAIRRDGSTATIHQFVSTPTGHRLPEGRYMGLVSNEQGTCGLLADNGSVRCEGAPFPTALPEGPFVQISASYAQRTFVGLRVDGLIVMSSHNHLYQLGSGLRFSDFDGYQQIPGCARDLNGTLHCFSYDAEDAVVLVPQPDTDIRDYSQHNGWLCVIQREGSASCRDAMNDPSSSVVRTGARFVDIDTRGPTRTCAVTEEGKLLCWDDTSAGNLREIALTKPAATE